MKTVTMFQVLENEDTLEACVLAESVPRKPMPRDSLTGALSSTGKCWLIPKGFLTLALALTSCASWCQREATVCPLLCGVSATEHCHKLCN